MFGFEAGFLDVVTVCRGLGIVGFAFYVLGFLLLSTGQISSDTQIFFVLNLLAAMCVMVSLTVDFNLSAALIQGFYAVLSLLAMMKRARTRRSPLRP